jgi:hypothetical protein
LFFLSVEGSKTEVEYFTFFNRFDLPISVIPIKRQPEKSSPNHVFKQMIKHIGKDSKNLKKEDEAWIVIDRDDWPENQIQKLLNWEQKKEKHNVAISNPNFEYWLLLHFEKGSQIKNSKDCLNRLRSFLPNYQKSIDMRKITLEAIEGAIREAKLRCKNQIKNNSKIWSTNVYILVERILNS